MKQFIILVLSFGLLLVNGVHAEINVWPHPQNVNLGNGVVDIAVSKDFFSYTKHKQDGIAEFRRLTSTSNIIDFAIRRYMAITFPKPKTNGEYKNKVLTKVDIQIEDWDESHPQLGHDESYTLTIGESGVATLHANTVWGAMHGMETFSQLVEYSYDGDVYQIHSTPIRIKDKPRFPHRGLMLDTSRHFHSIPMVKRLISSLPFAKLNVFHWHVTDAQSFPLEFKSWPKLWEGSYSKQERYSQAEVASVVEFARKRGVRVMVEFDMPGHANSWCKGYPSLCPSKTCLTPLNVARDETFKVIEDILLEITGGSVSTKGNPKGLVPDSFLHLGGDEVDQRCWESEKEIKSWRKKRNFSTKDAFAYFVDRVANITISQGRRPVQWIEVFDLFGTKLHKETIVHVWKDAALLTKVVKNGYNAILSGPNWYLDHLPVTWKQVYDIEPCANVTTTQCDLVLGGHGEMWSETVDDSDLFNTVWPRLGAIAERLWSPKEAKSTSTTLQRLMSFRCLLNRRGISAAPVLNGKARSPPSKPGGCYEQ